MWNRRRRTLIQALESESLEQTDQRRQEAIQIELHLTFSLLRKFPKCYWIWNHRNWTLQKGEAWTGTTHAQELWHGELQLVGKMLQSDSRNFHAWSYRRFVVAQLERLDSTTRESSTGSKQSLVESEFEYTTKMISANLSNFSAWHQRSRLIPRLLNERNADETERRKMLDSELAWICTAVNTDPFDQSIWYYHAFLMNTLSPACPQQHLIALELSDLHRQKYYEHEMEYIGEILDDEQECKWIYEALLDCAWRYRKVGGSEHTFDTRDMHMWLESLKKLDPLRNGRWDDVARQLNL